MTISADISAAIERRLIVVLDYNGETRRVEPHLLGFNKKGNLTLSAWQLSGRSDWRAFLVEKISQFQVTEERFTDVRPGYNPDDGTMSQILTRC